MLSPTTNAATLPSAGAAGASASRSAHAPPFDLAALTTSEQDGVRSGNATPRPVDRGNALPVVIAMATAADRDADVPPPPEPVPEPSTVARFVQAHAGREAPARPSIGARAKAYTPTEASADEPASDDGDPAGAPAPAPASLSPAQIVPSTTVTATIMSGRASPTMPDGDAIGAASLLPGARPTDTPVAMPGAEAVLADVGVSPALPMPNPPTPQDGGMTAALVAALPAQARAALRTAIPSPAEGKTMAFVSPDARFAPPAAAAPTAAVTTPSARDDRDNAPPPPPSPPSLLPTPITSGAAIATAPPDLPRDPAAQIGRIAAQLEAVRDAADARDTRIRIAPDRLGTIDLSVRTDGDALHVRFSAEQAQTRAMLADAQPRLAEIVEARGLRLGGSSVDGGQPQPQSQSQPKPQRRSAPPPSSTAARPAPIADRADDDGRLA